MRTEAPSGACCGFGPMDWTRGARSGEHARSQVLFCAYIARSTACRCCLSVQGFDGKARGVEVPYLVKDNEGHGFRNEENQHEFYGAMESLLGKHLKSDAPRD